MYVFRHLHVSTGSIESCFVITFSTFSISCCFFSCSSCSPACVYAFVPAREYADMVRQRIETLGLKVDMAQLSPTVNLAESLDNAARRGLLYTIIITPQHESHRSVTLTILHGRNPQGGWLENKGAASFLPFNFRKEGLFSMQIFHTLFCISVFSLW